jgi:hypothetical protein
MSDDIAVGIDLGTSYSCVAAALDGAPQVIPNEWGEHTHASVVSFLPEGSVLVGNNAKKNIITNAENTVYSAKRLIGRFYFSDEVKKAQAVMPYRITEGPNNSVRVDVGGRAFADLEAFLQLAVGEQHRHSEPDPDRGGREREGCRHCEHREHCTCQRPGKPRRPVSVHLVLRLNCPLTR